MAEKHPEHPPVAGAEDMAPDPDEDDLSDLDDMLEEFSAANIRDKKPAAAAENQKPPPAAATQPQPAPSTAEDNDFARLLQEGMAGLLGPADQSPDVQKQMEDMTALFGQFDQDPDMQKQLEAMIKDLSAVAAQEAAEPLASPPPSTAPSAPAPASSSSHPASKPSTDKPASAPAPAPTFQDTIKKTMERMQNSGESASAAAASSTSDDILAQMLAEMEGGDFSGLDGQNPDDFNQMLMGMMEQLTNKDILYEPMKELHDKFPAWLSKNEARTAKADLARYKDQQQVVGDIVARFERSGYTDEDKADREYIVQKMQQMQAAGAPPPDLVGDMSAAQDALADLDGGCPQQ